MDVLHLMMLVCLQGEVLAIVSKDSGKEGWWQAKNEGGQEGLIPSNYVQLSCAGLLFLLVIAIS
jgi:hypothetical protein